MTDDKFVNINKLNTLFSQTKNHRSLLFSKNESITTHKSISANKTNNLTAPLLFTTSKNIYIEKSHGYRINHTTIKSCFDAPSIT